MAACAATSLAQSSGVVATGAKLQNLAGDFEFTEGPTVDSQGNVCFTDPFYRRVWWAHDSMPQDGQHVYKLSPDRQTVVRVATDLKQPNGIIGSPDGRTLFVADIGAGRTYRYDIRPDGSLANGLVFCESGSDGMTLDNEGNLYLTGKGVAVFDKRGRKVEQIDVPEPWSANVCIGGKDRKTLFITASTGLYAIALRVKGTNQGK